MSHESLLDINDLNFETEVLESKGTFVLDFGAVWCGPCRLLLPVVESIAKDYEGRLRVGKLDTDDSPESAARFRVRAVPTIIVFQNGREIARHVGLTTRAKLLAMIGESPSAEIAAG
jgi:thioredoxin 1